MFVIREGPHLVGGDFATLADALRYWADHLTESEKAVSIYESIGGGALRYVTGYNQEVSRAFPITIYPLSPLQQH